MPDPEPTQRELIELEVKRALAGEVEGYRKTLESHNAYIEKSTKWIASAFIALASAAVGIFYYFFGHSIDAATKAVPDIVRQQVNETFIVEQTKLQISNSIAAYSPRLESEAIMTIESNILSKQTEFTAKASGELQESISQSIQSQVGKTIHESVSKTLEDALNQINSSTATQRVQFALPIPIGAIEAFGGSEVDPKSGWLPCDGRALSRTEFASLFKAIGTGWGAGDGTNTFNLPDLRGLFLRGVDGSAGRDPDRTNRVSLIPGGFSGNTVGSYQPDAVGSHQHDTFIKPYGGQDLIWTDPRHVIVASPISAFPQEWGKGLPTGFSGGIETRPKNAYVYYIIKYN